MESNRDRENRKRALRERMIDTETQMFEEEDELEEIEAEAKRERGRHRRFKLLVTGLLVLAAAAG